MGRRVWVNGGRIRIEGKWWRWDEEEVLKDEGGLGGGKSGEREVRVFEREDITENWRGRVSDEKGWRIGF